MRNRTRSSPSVGSRWTSEARSRSASVTSMVTTLATGESAARVSSRLAVPASRGASMAVKALTMRSTSARAR